MSETQSDAATYLDLRLRRDGITLNEEERARLIELVPIAAGWVQELTFEETRYAEPVLTHPLT